MNFDQLAQQTAERIAADVVKGGQELSEVIAAAKPIIRAAIGTATNELGREIDQHRQKIEEQVHAIETLSKNVSALRAQFERLRRQEEG